MRDVAALYDDDFVRWSEEQASALRSAALTGTNLTLDWEHLAEEIDCLGKSLRSELRNRLAIVVEHLLKLAVSPAVDPRAGWMETINRERIEVEMLLDENPSLRAALAESIASADRKGRRLARVALERHAELDATIEREVRRREFTAEQVLGPWLPALLPEQNA